MGSAVTVEAIYEATARILQAGGREALNTNLIAEKAGVSIGRSTAISRTSIRSSSTWRDERWTCCATAWPQRCSMNGARSRTPCAVPSARW